MVGIAVAWGFDHSKSRQALEQQRQGDFEFEAGKRRTAGLIERIAKNHTVLLIEHDMDLVRQLAKKVTVMHQGQLLAEGPLAEVVENPTVQAVYLGKGGRH